MSYPRMPRGTCYESSRILAAAYPELTYVEGYVVLVTPGHPDVRVEHAWNETADGQVVDSTWEYPDQERRYEHGVA